MPPTQMFTVPEVLAMLKVIGAPPPLRAKFTEHAALVLAKRPAFTDADDRFEVASSYGARTREGFVDFKTGTVVHQLGVRKAREIAFMILEAAEAALSDATVMKLLRERVGIADEQRLGEILLDLREFRQGSRETVYPQ